jgi:hypothetical protein
MPDIDLPTSKVRCPLFWLSPMNVVMPGKIKRPGSRQQGTSDCFMLATGGLQGLYPAAV